MIDLRQISTKITSNYGWRTDPINGKQKYHSGMDMVLSNDRVPSINSGTVETVGKSSTWGNYVTIRHADGTSALYAHLASPSNLIEGSAISEGTIIGTQGSTGRSTGKHLHLTMRDAAGELIDPAEYMSGGGSFSVSNLSDTIPG